jgi:hypothetical protein
MAVKMSMVLFLVVMPCELVERYQSFGGFMNEDGDSEFLQNYGVYLHVNTASTHKTTINKFSVFF